MTHPMLLKLATLWPQLALGLGACFCLLLGLWNSPVMRRLSVLAAAVSLALAGLFTLLQAGQLDLPVYVNLATVGLGLLLLMVAAQVPDEQPTIRQLDQGKRPFDPALVFRGEFYAFFLLSLAGLMLVGSADDLVWLFLALELVSLPTYVMVAISRPQPAAQESAVKYFFLGALAVAIFLYGFALIFGATGLTNLAQIRLYVAEHGVSPLLLLGLVLAIVGISFKIAAVPMHLYVADVYQGASTPVTAFLAFVPKSAGFVALILLLNTLWNAPAGSAASATASLQLPAPIFWLLALMAVATMTVGNVLGLLQTSVKRVLAYSSIAHSGYMLVGLVAVGSMTRDNQASTLGQGVAAVLFYLVAYGLATLAAFAVLGCLKAHGREADDYEDLSGLARRQPALAAILLVSLLSLIGLPPLAGFLGKVYLFGSAIQQGHLWLVIVAVLNSAVSAVYYLRIAAACYFGPDNPHARATPNFTRTTGAALASAGALALGLGGSFLVELAGSASDHRYPQPPAALPQQPSSPIVTQAPIQPPPLPSNVESKSF